MPEDREGAAATARLRGTLDHENFYCQTNPQDDPALLAPEAGLLQGEGPLKGNHDIGNPP